jgi:hypothetical protein
MTSKSTKYFQAARAAGLCGQCQKRPAKPNRAMCAECAEYHASHRKGLHLPEEQRAAYIAKRTSHVKKWQAKNPDKCRQYARDERAKLRSIVFDHYGWECKCCGETTERFLTIDHINGGGYQHRREIKNALYRWLIQNSFPSEFQTLCMNCNFAKGRGECPHVADSDFVWVKRSYSVNDMSSVGG